MWRWEKSVFRMTALVAPNIYASVNVANHARLLVWIRDTQTCLHKWAEICMSAGTSCWCMHTVEWYTDACLHAAHPRVEFCERMCCLPLEATFNLRRSGHVWEATFVLLGSSELRTSVCTQTPRFRGLLIIPLMTHLTAHVILSGVSLQQAGWWDGMQPASTLVYIACSL